MHYHVLTAIAFTFVGILLGSVLTRSRAPSESPAQLLQCALQQLKSDAAAEAQRQARRCQQNETIQSLLKEIPS